MYTHTHECASTFSYIHIYVHTHTHECASTVGSPLSNLKTCSFCIP